MLRSLKTIKTENVVKGSNFVVVTNFLNSDYYVRKPLKTKSEEYLAYVWFHTLFFNSLGLVDFVLVFGFFVLLPDIFFLLKIY